MDSDAVGTAAMATGDEASFPDFDDICLQGNADAQQRLSLFLLDDETNTYAAFVPAGMQDDARLVLPENVSLLLNGILYENGDHLPFFDKEDACEPAEGKIYDPAVTEEAVNLEKNQKTIAYAGMDVSYKVSDGVLVNAEIQAGENWDKKGYIRFYYGIGIPSVFITTKTAGIDEINQDYEKYEDISAVFIDAEGRVDTSAEGIIRGRGHGSADTDEKPYSLNLNEEYPILGMGRASKWALLNNYMGGTQRLCDKIALDLGQELGLRYTPDSQFINVYINGVYNGFYLLAQRVNANGGSVKIHNLRKDNRKLNQDYYDELESEATEEEEGLYDRSEVDPYYLFSGAEGGDGYSGGGSGEWVNPEGGVPEVATSEKKEVLLHTGSGSGEAEEKENDFRDTALPVSPSNITGGYLLEFDHYNNGVYFPCGSTYVSVRSPKETTTEEFQYISDYMNRLDRAIHAEDGIDPESGISYVDYLDMNSWIRDFIMKNFFGEADTDWSSFYMYKEENDDHLYAGPVWDYELSMGHGYMENENHPEVSQRALWVQDCTDGWLHVLGENPAFQTQMMDTFQEVFVPLVEEYLENQFDEITANLEPSVSMNAVRWDALMPDTEEEIQCCRNWLAGRMNFLSAYYAQPESYCKAVFHFRWGNYTAYVKKGEELGFVPTWQYHESTSMRDEDYSYLDHWQDSDGKLVSANTVVTDDTDFYSVYQLKLANSVLDVDSLYGLDYVLQNIPETDCNAIILISEEEWENQKEWPAYLDGLLEEQGVNPEEPADGTTALIFENHRLYLIRHAEESGASSQDTADSPVFKIFFSEDQFGIYRDGDELFVGNKDRFPTEGGGRLFVTEAGDWHSVRFVHSIDQP